MQDQSPLALAQARRDGPSTSSDAYFCNTFPKLSLLVSLCKHITAFYCIAEETNPQQNIFNSSFSLFKLAKSY